MDPGANVAAAALLLLAVSLSAQSPAQERAAIRAAKRANVHALDPSLPNRPFASWLQSIVGSKTKVTWEVNDCGEQTGSGHDDPESIPMCAEAQAQPEPELSVTVSLMVGTFSKGVFGTPDFWFALVKRGKAAHSASKLSDVPRLLRQ